MRAKLLEALKAHEQNGDSDDVAIKFENCSKSYPLNMFAINEGPRLRLLWAAFQQLQQEASILFYVCSAGLFLVLLNFLRFLHVM